MKLNSLEEIFETLTYKTILRKWIKRRVCKVTLGSSIIRVFNSNTKGDMVVCLSRIDLTQLKKINSQTKFDEWHSAKLNTVYNCLRKRNRKKFAKNLEGLKWGHSAKIFNLFLGHLINYSPYFGNERDIEKIKKYLHVPFDNKVFNVLKDCNIKAPKSIKSITRLEYKNLQLKLRKVATSKKVVTSLFDEYAWASD